MIRHLYFHIPFCARLCPYCNFTVDTRLRLKNRLFVEAILAEVRQRADRFEIRPRTLFFGGGTPSALSLSELELLVGGMREALDLSGVAEWSLEINPATVSKSKAKRLIELGFNRASVGVQSWNDRELRALGRIHSAGQAAETLDLLREAGFQNIGVDLMFAIPGQTLRSWGKSLEQTIRTGVGHVSAYCLTFEGGTDFFSRLERGEMRRDESLEADCLEQAIDRLADAGYRHYEISNHALPGFESEHNRAYWLGNEYLGIGPGAFSTASGRRWKNRADTVAYIAEARSGSVGEDFSENLSPETLAGERAAFGIRMLAGCPESDLSRWSGEIAELIDEGLMERAAGRVRLTRRGQLLADAIAEVFVG